MKKRILHNKVSTKLPQVGLQHKAHQMDTSGMAGVGVSRNMREGNLMTYYGGDRQFQTIETT